MIEVFVYQLLNNKIVLYRFSMLMNTSAANYIKLGILSFVIRYITAQTAAKEHVLNSFFPGV